MKILYDHQIFIKQHFGGISRYFCEIMDKFSRDPEIDFCLALRYSQNEHLYQQPQLNRFWTRRNDFFSDSHFFTRLQRGTHINALNHVFNNQQESIRRLKEQDFDVFHPTYYDPYFLKYLGNRPFVLTIHDMMQERFPKHFGRSDPAREWKRILAMRAQKIIAVSETTKEDIIHFLSIPEEKIQTIYHGTTISPVSMKDLYPASSCGSLPELYLLFIGNRIMYKNFPFFIEALSTVFKKHDHLHLVCAGGGIFSASERYLFQSIGILSRVHWFPADDATLLYLYRNAYAFVFPTLYEGFGLPVLDAFSCGCPALLSDTGSLPEIGGNAALYFDPTDKASLTATIEQILSDERLKRDLIARGRERAKLFSWEKTAAMTKKVYEAVIE